MPRVGWRRPHATGPAPIVNPMNRAEVEGVAGRVPAGPPADLAPGRGLRGGPRTREWRLQFGGDLEAAHGQHRALAEHDPADAGGIDRADAVPRPGCPSGQLPIRPQPPSSRTPLLCLLLEPEVTSSVWSDTVRARGRAREREGMAKVGAKWDAVQNALATSDDPPSTTWRMVQRPGPLGDDGRSQGSV